MKISCSNCNESFEVSDELEGQTIECPNCNQSLTAPQKRPSLIVRVAVGLLGLPFLVFPFLLLADGKPLGTELSLALLIGVAFMLYFFGGPRLLQKIGLGFLVQPVGGGSKGTLAPSVVLGGGAVVEPATGNDINEGIAAFQQQLAILTPRAFLTPAIVAINLIVFTIMIAVGVHIMSPKIVDLLAWGANYAPKTTGGEWWRLVTSNYLHIGVIHIAFNMWVFWSVGQFVERLVGNLGFFLVYLFSGVVGGFATVLWNPGAVSAGASGAVFGVYGCLLAFLASDRGSIPRPVLKALGNNAVFFVVVNVLYGMGNENVDMAAHLGGLAAGFVSGLILRIPLDCSASKNRGRRNMLVGIAGVFAISAGVALTGNRYADIQEELRLFGETEETVMGSFNETIQKVRTGSMSDDAFASILREGIIAPWEAALSEFESDTAGKLPKLSERNSKLHGKLLKYMHLRLEAFQLMLEAVEGNDQQKAEQANAKLAESQAIVDSLQNGDN
jgi:rhomboid protease GluP